MMKQLKILTGLTVLLLSIVPSAWAWQIDRPSPHVNMELKDRTESALTTNGKVSVGLGASIDHYTDNWGDYENRDFVNMNVSLTASCRVGITYSIKKIDSCWIRKDQLTNPTETYNLGDDSGMWVNFPTGFAFRFYGGKHSAEYKSVWVSSNGFISFDLSNSTSKYPATIPYDAAPNAMIAPLWTDLWIDGSASIVTGLHERALGEPLFVITWNNALHKASGLRFNFQVTLENAPSWDGYGITNRQSDIHFDYDYVTTVSTQFTYGIEDQEGRRGHGYLCNGADLQLLLRKNVWFQQNSNNFFLDALKISGFDASPNTGFRVSRFAGDLRGYHVDTGANSQTDPNLRFKKALLGTGTLLITVGGLIAGVPTWPVTLPINFITVSQLWIDHFASLQYSNVNPTELRDEVSDPSVHGEFYILVPTYAFSVDASMDIVLHWIMPCDHTQSHTLTLTAEAHYSEHNRTSHQTTYNTTITSVNLVVTPDISSNFSNPRWVSGGARCEGTLDQIDLADMYAINVPGINKLIKVRLTPPEDANYDLYLYDPSQTEADSSTNAGDSSEIIQHYTGSQIGNWYIKVSNTYWPGHLQIGLYRLSVDILTPPPGGCPYVSSWNGTQYVLDNNLLPTSEANRGIDVEDYYKLEQVPIPINGKYSLLLSEFEQEYSYFDQVRLFAVDHESCVNIAVTQDGQILTYKNLAAPISAVDNYGNNRLSEISVIDGNGSNPATYFDGQTSDYLVLNFGQIKSDNTKLILKDDRKCEHDYCCIDVQVRDGVGGWRTVEHLAPRNYWATQAVDLSPYVVKGQQLDVKLYWTSPHRLDFVGLDTSKQKDYELHTADLVSATHSTQGDVKAQLLQSDNIYAELVPDQQIQLEFTLPNNTKEARAFILYTKGHYYIIP